MKSPRPRRTSNLRSGADEHVLDEQSQDPLALGDGRSGGLAAQPVRKSSRLSAIEVDLPVGGLAVEHVDLVMQAGLAGALLGRTGPECVEGDQLLLVGADEPTATRKKALRRQRHLATPAPPRP